MKNKFDDDVTGFREDDWAFRDERQVGA